MDVSCASGAAMNAVQSIHSTNPIMSLLFGLKGAFRALFFLEIGVSPASAGEASRRDITGQSGQIFQNPRTRRKQNKTMKNTRGEREGGRRPHSQTAADHLFSADDLDGGSH